LIVKDKFKQVTFDCWIVFKDTIYEWLETNGKLRFWIREEIKGFGWALKSKLRIMVLKEKKRGKKRNWRGLDFPSFQHLRNHPFKIRNTFKQINCIEFEDLLMNCECYALVRMKWYWLCNGWVLLRLVNDYYHELRMSNVLM